MFGRKKEINVTAESPEDAKKRIVLENWVLKTKGERMSALGLNSASPADCARYEEMLRPKLTELRLIQKRIKK